jgi:hypothetical protein
MIVEERLLERRRVELAIFAEEEERLRRAVRLARDAHAEAVRLGLLEAGEGVGHRRQHEHEATEERMASRRSASSG